MTDKLIEAIKRTDLRIKELDDAGFKVGECENLARAIYWEDVAVILNAARSTITPPMGDVAEMMAGALKKIMDGMPETDDDYYEGSYHQYKIIAQQALSAYEASKTQTESEGTKNG